MLYYQVVSNVEDDVHCVQTVANVLPVWRNHNHRLGASPGKVVVVVTLKKQTYHLN